MRKRFQNSINSRLGDIRALVNLLERFGLVFRLQQFQDVQRLGKHRDEVESLGSSSGRPTSHERKYIADRRALGISIGIKHLY